MRTLAHKIRMEGNAVQKPQASALQKPFNALKYERFPWLRDGHREAHAQPFAE